jgi:aspartyl/asparaginyl-tRNA synthetase
MKGFYQVTETIKNQLLADVNVNTVTSGDITRIDLSKQTMFPLSHIIVNNVGNEDSVLRFSLSVLSMDVVDFSKEEVIDIFRGNNNEQDILNTQLAVLNKLVQVLRGGTLHQDLYQLDGTPNLEPFYDRFENEMAGWALTFDVLVPNDIEIC